MTVEDVILILDGIHNCCECADDDEMAERLEAVQMAKEALEMWVLKKPVKDEYGHDCCPTCGYAGIYKDEWGGRYIPHCENCGQAIDWEDIANDSR